jgi:hypothetical protein
VTVERPSSHAAIVHLDYGVTPAHVAAVGISRSPLREWHAFATVSTPGRSGYRLLVSRAGDWTSRFIDDPPSHLWVRGVPTRAPIPAIEVMYRRVIYVVTGSGIGPVLGQILSPRVPGRLVWSARSPRATYGDALVDEVLAVHPDAVIWDTAERGKPDLCGWPMMCVVTSRPRRCRWSATRLPPGAWCTAWSGLACPRSARSGTRDVRCRVPRGRRNSVIARSVTGSRSPNARMSTRLGGAAS